MKWLAVIALASASHVADASTLRFDFVTTGPRDGSSAAEGLPYSGDAVGSIWLPAELMGSGGVSLTGLCGPHAPSCDSTAVLFRNGIVGATFEATFWHQDPQDWSWNPHRMSLTTQTDNVTTYPGWYIMLRQNSDGTYSGGFGMGGDEGLASVDTDRGGNVTAWGGPVFGGHPDGDFFFDRGVWTISSPVPEPATYGLMLAGLAAVAVVARRRRRCRSSNDTEE